MESRNLQLGIFSMRECKINAGGNNVAHSWGNKTILIVEDEEINFFYLKESLEETNVNLIYADNGCAAIDIFRSNPKIDLVLMDIKMPLMNGYTATSKIKAIRPYVPVIAQTAYALSGERKKSIDAGCDGYISKPIMPGVLIATLSKYLGK